MIEINLLPHREAKRVADLRESIALLVLGLLVIAAGVLFFNGKVADEMVAARATVQQLESDIGRYKPQQMQVASFRRQKSGLEDKLDVIKSLENARSGPVRMFDELAAQIPERVWLTRMKTKAGRLILEGNSLDNGVVADFLRALNKSEYFANVDLVKTGGTAPMNGIRLVRFEISANLVTPDPETEGQAEPAGA
jgi:type IV pilus assembly protein PilN